MAPTEQDWAMHWTRSFAVQLPNGWVVRECQGDRTNVCVHGDGEFLGDIELLGDYPLTPEQAEQPARQAAREWAEDFVETFREDRSQGCSDFTFEGDGVADAVVGGRPGARSGFTLTDAQGNVVERVVTHYVRRGETMTIVNTDAYASDGGCLGPAESDPSFTPEELATFEPHLDQLVAATPLPRR